MKRKKLLESSLLPLFAALLITALIWIGVARNGGEHVVWPEMNNPSTQSGLKFRGDRKGFSLDQGDAYGPITSGPHYTLPAGTYRLKWTIETDAENVLRIVSSNNAQIEPSQIAIPANTWTTYMEFELLQDAENVQLVIDFNAGTYLRVQDIELRGLAFTDQAWTMTFLVWGACLIWYLSKKGSMTQQRWDVLLLLGLAVAISVIPSLKSSINWGYDSHFHWARLLNQVSALRDGQFPARVGGFTYQGYGAATSAFYPELFCYFPAMLILTGASLQYAINAYMIAMSMVTAALMYLCGKRLTDDHWAGLFASIVYTLAAYRITDMYTRIAVGEAMAIAVLPLFIWGLWEVIAGNKSRWILLSFGATFVFQSHMLSTLICAAFALAIGILFIGKIIREKRMGAIVKAVVVTLLLNLFFLVPFMTLSRQGAGASMLVGWNAINAKSVAQLLMQGTGLLDKEPVDTAMGKFALEIGFPLILGAVLGLREALKLDKKDGMKKAILFACAGGVLFAYMITPQFPWDTLSVITKGMSNYLQFPWRLLMMVNILFALVAGFGFSRMAGEHKGMMAAVVLSVAALSVLPHLSNLASSNWVMGYGQTTTSNILHEDYSLPDSNMWRTGEQELLIDGEVTVSEYEKRSTKASMYVEAKTEGMVSLPLFGFDGYAAELDGERLAWMLGDNNRLTVLIPAGAKGTLRIWYEGKMIWRVADAVSLATLATLVMFWEKQRMRKRKDEAKR